MQRDDPTPSPWSKEGKKRIKQLGLTMQYPEGYLEAQAQKEKEKEEGGETPSGKKGKGKRKREEDDEESKSTVQPFSDQWNCPLSYIHYKVRMVHYIYLGVTDYDLAFKLFLYPATLKSAGYYVILSIQKIAFECLFVRPSIRTSVSASFSLCKEHFFNQFSSNLL